MKSGRFLSGEATLWTDKMIDVISKILPYILTPRMVDEYKVIWACKRILEHGGPVREYLLLPLLGKLW